MKKTFSMIMAMALMLTSVPMQGLAEDAAVADSVGVEAISEETNDDVFVEDEIVDEEAIQENETEAVAGDADAFVQSVNVVEAEYDSDDEITDLGETMGAPQTIADDTRNALEVNSTYKLAELKSRRGGGWYPGLYFDMAFTTIGTGRVKVCLENSQSPDLYSLSTLENLAGDIKLVSATESTSSNWVSVTEGEHVLGFYYDSRLAAEADATVTIKYESADEYIGEIEPNDSYDTANELPFGASFWGNKDSKDYFYFILDKPDQVSLDQEGCSSIYLYSEDENRNVSFLTEVTIGAELQLDKLRLPAGKYYLQVNGGAEKEYSIKVERKNETSDSAEQEDNNLSSKANLLNCNVSYAGNINYYSGSGRLIGGDIDWFRFEVPEKSAIQLQTQIPRQTTGSLTETLYDGVLSELGSLTTDRNPYKETDQFIVDAGTYYVKITGENIPQTSWDYSVCLSQEKFIPVTNIELPETLQIMNGKSQLLPVSILPEDASVKTLNWESSNTRVVSVDDSGMLTAEAVGEATIVAEARDGSGIVGMCEVQVGREIKYNLDGGVNNPENPAAYYGGTITLKEPTREGCHFLGWYEDRWSNYGKVDTITEDGPFEVYARWVEPKPITYVLNGGTNNPENPTEFYGDEITLKPPTRPGYVFYLWVDQNKNAVTEITEDTLTVYAIWHKICTINYVLNGGTNNKHNLSTFVEGTEITPRNPTRPGYIFTGWYSNANLTSKVQLVYGDATLYAGWAKVAVGKASIKSLTNKKGKKAALKIRQVSGASGYEIVYSTSRKFKKNVKTKTTKNLSATLKKLKKKKYYFKVRAYKKDSTGAKVYGSYSNVKKVKIRK